MSHHILFIHSSVDRHLGFFQVLAIVNNAQMNMRVQISFQDTYLVSLGCIYPEVGLLDHVSSNFNF